MHYNENAHRPQATTTQGQAVFRIAFPKSKQGECSVKPVKTDPTFSKLENFILKNEDNKIITYNRF